MNFTHRSMIFDKGRLGIMLTSMFLGLISVANGSYAQDAGQKPNQHGSEPVLRKRAGTMAYEKLLSVADALIKNGKPADPCGKAKSGVVCCSIMPVKGDLIT